MIKQYLKMKKKEIQLKLTIYSYANDLLSDKENIIKVISNIYIALKDTPINELQDKLISEIASFIHEQSTEENIQKDK